MKVTMRNYQRAAAVPYKKQAPSLPEDPEDRMDAGAQAGLGLNGDIDAKAPGSVWNPMEKEEQESSLNALLEQAKESSNFKISTSMPDDSVGQLATELARSETRMDVVQVSSKAMRALANLKMSYVLSEGKEKEKIAQMIRRMERLTKKIHKKMRHLNNEEQLELQRKRAQKGRSWNGNLKSARNSAAERPNAAGKSRTMRPERLMKTANRLCRIPSPQCLPL